MAPPEPDPPHNLARPEAAQRLAQALWQAVHLGTDREFVDAPIEYRWPLLDTRLIEFAFAIPPMPWCQRKEIMRRALRGRVPDDVVTRPKITVPGYFEAAIAEWQNRTGASCPPLHERTADFVDPSKLAEALRSGETEQVLGGWRALQFDAWIRGMEAA